MIADPWIGLTMLVLILLCGINCLVGKLQARSNRVIGVLQTPLHAEAEAEDIVQPLEYFLQTVHLVHSRGWRLGLKYFQGGLWLETAVFIPYGHPAEVHVRYQRINRLRFRFRRIPDANPRQVASYLHMDIISYKT